ncbi:MAG: LPS assembly protein LptD [Planctomycetota bacterium]|jgi:hypothetical protein
MSSARFRSADVWAVALVGGLAIPLAPAAGQEAIPPAGDRLSGFVLPIEPLTGDTYIESLRAWSWDAGDTKRLLLQREVTLRIGQQIFRAEEAVVWINRIPSAQGLINQIAVFFDELRDPKRQSGLGVGGTELLLTASARGAVELNVALLERGPPPRRGLVERAERRLAAYLQRLRVEPLPPLGRFPQLQEPPPEPGAGPEAQVPLEVDLPPTEAPLPPLFVPRGTIRFSAARTTVSAGPDENVVTAIGSIVVDYAGEGEGDRWSRLTLSAERAVVFTDPGPIEDMFTGGMDAEAIRGIYLEGNVTATAGEGVYVVRAPQVYYDLRTDQAIMLEAVLRTYSRGGRLPIYARAREMRQIAANQWTARRVRVSTSEFLVPHLAVGAQRITVTQRPSPADPDDTVVHLDSRHNTLQAGGVPFVYWPQFSGTIEDIPLRRIKIGSRENDGVRIETTWNPFSLLGVERPSGVEADLHLDGFTERGAGAGLDFSYERGPSQGEAELYGLYDDGEDRTSSGRDVDQDDEWRGIALWEHRMGLTRDWSLQAQGAWISDETFVTTWREDDFVRRREYESSLYLQHQDDNAALTLLAKYDLNEFISNSYLLASRQYQVEKLPELTYRRYGDSWFGDRITYSGESRVSRVRFNFETSTPRELGVRGRAFGVPDDVRISDALRARGLSSSAVNRFDSRHELSLPFKGNGFQMVPFLVGRLTAYDEDFEEFSDQADKTRVFGAAGLRLHAQFQRVDNDVESPLFDLHRLRHLVEPRLLAWYGFSDVSDDDLPVYDEEVESIGTGSVVEVGLRNVWQTQRGGPGRWRSVDFLTLDTAAVLSSDDANRESPSPQFFEYRPEYSQFGDHVHTELMWVLSDHFSVAGEATYDLDESVLSRGSIGTELRHSPLLATFVEYRYLDASENELLEIGWSYLLTPKYRVSLRPQWDFQANEFRSVSLRVVRRFPEFDLTIQVRHDEIKDDTSLGASIGLVEF